MPFPFVYPVPDLAAALFALGFWWFFLGGLCWVLAIVISDDAPPDSTEVPFVVFAWPAFLVVTAAAGLVLAARLAWAAVRALVRVVRARQAS